MSKAIEMTKLAVSKGYIVDDKGVLYSPKGKIRKTCLRGGGYPYISLKDPVTGSTYGIAVHKIVAYIKYGEAAFAAGIETRHLDGNKSNYSPSNIAIGDHSDNVRDIPKEIRVRSAKTAAAKLRKFTDEQIKTIRTRLASGEEGSTLAREFGVVKSTISYIKLGKTYQEAV